MTELEEDYDAYQHVGKEEKDGVRIHEESTEQVKNEDILKIRSWWPTRS